MTTLTKLKAFHGDPKIKNDLLDQLKSHYKHDEIVQGKYWGKGKGCAVGCTLHSRDHSLYEKRFGIPEVLAHLEDSIFEGLPNAEAKEFPLQFIQSIPVGADLSLVWPAFASWLLTDPEQGVVRFNSDPSIKTVGQLFQRQLSGKSPKKEEWDAARDAARVAARDAARVAAWAARDAARVAGDAARVAARDAAWAARVAARDAARVAGDAARIAQRDKLLSLLADPPVVEVK